MLGWAEHVGAVYCWRVRWCFLLFYEVAIITELLITSRPCIVLLALWAHRYRPVRFRGYKGLRCTSTKPRLSGFCFEVVPYSNILSFPVHNWYDLV